MKQPVERRLAAILAADVAGYSRLMGADEEGTLERLKALRCGLQTRRIDPKGSPEAAVVGGRTIIAKNLPLIAPGWGPGRTRGPWAPSS
jgi:hypothetical protein